MSYKIQIHLTNDKSPEPLTTDAIAKALVQKIENRDFSDLKLPTSTDRESVDALLSDLKQFSSVRFGEVGYGYGMGGSYGTGWTCYISPTEIPIVSINTCTSELMATINSELFLAEIFGEPDTALGDAFHSYCGAREYSDGREGIEYYCEAHGMEFHGDNTCNYENDLGFEIQWHVACKPISDWVHDAQMIFIELHGGGDVRGNYRRTVVFNLTDSGHDEPMFYFLGPVVSWYLSEATDKDGKELSDSELREIEEEWQRGYSSNPTYELNKSLESFEIIDSFTARVVLKSGITGVVGVDSYFGG